MKEHQMSLLASLKAEHYFIQFVRPAVPTPSATALGLYDRIFSVHEVMHGATGSSFHVIAASGASPQKIPVPVGKHTFQVVVPSDFDGDYGHEYGIAKFAFLVGANVATS
jgi:hypothetical protein